MRRLELMFRVVIILVLTYVFSLGTTFSGVIVPDLKFFNLLLVTLFVIIWALIRWRGRWQSYRNPLDLVFVLWLLVILISILANQDSWRRSLIGLWYVGLYILLWLVFSDCINNKRLKRDTLIDGLLFAGLIIISLGYIELSRQSFDLFSLNFPRPGSIIGNPNSLGAFLIVAIGFAGGRFLNIQNSLAKFVLGFYTLAALCLLFLTFSRGAWIGGAVTIFTLIILALRRSDLISRNAFLRWWGNQSRNSRYLITSAVVLSVTIALLAGVVFYQSLSLSGRSVDLRTRIWNHALTLFSEKPITGYGLFNFGREFERLDSMPPNQPHSHAHNAILLVAAELGILGLLVMSLTVFVALKAMDVNWHEAPVKDQAALTGAYAAVLGFGVHHLLDTPFMMPAIALGGLLALLVVVTPVQPQVFQATWQLRGRPIGIAVLAGALILSGFWSTAVSRVYTNALLYVNDDDYLLAAESMQNAIDADPYLAVYREQQAYLLGVVAENDDALVLMRAISGYARFLELEPQSAVGWANYGALLWQSGESDEAITAMQTAVEAAPDAWQFKLNLGAYLESRGPEDAARNLYAEVINSRIVLLPFWMETPLRQEIAQSVEIGELDRYLLGDEAVSYVSLNLSGNTPKVEYARLVNLLRENGSDPAIASQLDAVYRSIVVDTDRVWLDVARADILRANGDATGADAMLNTARERLAFDVVEPDYAFGVNIGYFQFLRYVVPRRFLPQVYYPTVDPFLLHLLDA